MSVPKRRCSRRKVCFGTGAIVLALLPFVLAECFLRMTGLGSASSYQDPFVGFSQLYPLFELNADAGEYRTARHHHYFFGLQSFPATKKPTTFRAFCLGGSTVLGHPYDIETAFPRWLAVELAGRDPSRDYEIVNCGGMSYASYRLIPVLEEVLNYDPDLIVVMTGHNEFLEDRTYHATKQRSPVRAWVEDRLFSLRMVTLGRRAMNSLRSGPPQTANKTTLDQRVDARLDHNSGYASYHRDEQWWKGVTEHFALNLRVMVRLCRQARVPLLLLNPGSNLRDCPPFKSEHASDLTSAQLAQWEAFFESASKAEVAFPLKALAMYQRAEAIDDQHAQLIYRIARCFDRLGQFEQAGAAYVRARELDVCPLRMLDVMRQSVLKVAETTSTPVVNAASLLEKQSRDGIVGFDWYVDHVHPSIRGHQLIAQAVASRLHDVGIVASKARQWSRVDRRKTYRRLMEDLGDQYLRAGRRRVKWLQHWARRERLRDDTLPLDTRAILDWGNLYVEFAEYEKSRVPYRMALPDDPVAGDQLMQRALQMFRSGRHEAVEWIAQIVIEFESNPSLIDRANVALAVLALDDGRTEAAIEHAKKVRSGSSNSDHTAHAWLEELPEAKSLFD